MVNALLTNIFDSDGDGLLDPVEDSLETNPLLEDTDADGVGDGQEMIDGTDPLMPPSGSANVIINEFKASTTTGLADEFGEFEDWIELYNGGPASVNLQGWSLTDDSLVPQKWIFPSVTIAPDGFLVVFASGNDITAGENLHSNFKIGRCLELVNDYICRPAYAA